MERILIHSYKGGTGKTTVALNLAGILAQKQKVLLIENDFMMPTFFSIFEHDPQFFLNDYLDKQVEFTDIIVKDLKPNLDIIFASKTFDPSSKVMSSDQKWFLQVLERMMRDLERLTGTYDYIIFDSPPGWHMIIINLILLATKAILILRPNKYAVEGSLRMIDSIYKRTKPLRSWEVFLLFNQIPQVEMKTDVEQWAQKFIELGITLAGQIPCSCETSYDMAHQVTIFPSDHEFNQSLNKALPIIFHPQK